MKQYTYEIKYCYTNNKLEETKRKMSIAHKGKTVSEETRKKQKGNKNALGNKQTDEAKRKIGEAQKGNKNWLGKHHTEETKRKLSEANKGVKKPLRNKKEEKGYEKTVL